MTKPQRPATLRNLFPLGETCHSLYLHVPHRCSLSVLFTRYPLGLPYNQQVAVHGVPFLEIYAFFSIFQQIVSHLPGRRISQPHENSVKYLNMTGYFIPAPPGSWQ